MRLLPECTNLQLLITGIHYSKRKRQYDVSKLRRRAYRSGESTSEDRRWRRQEWHQIIGRSVPLVCALPAGVCGLPGILYIAEDAHRDGVGEQIVLCGEDFLIRQHKAHLEDDTGRQSG